MIMQRIVKNIIKSINLSLIKATIRVKAFDETQEKGKCLKTLQRVYIGRAY